MTRQRFLSAWAASAVSLTLALLGTAARAGPPPWWATTFCDPCPDGILQFGAWTELGSGVDGPVNAFATASKELYVGGEFTEAGGQAADRVASWDGASWSALDGPLGQGANGPVSALAVFLPDPPILWVGGEFTSAGGVEVANAAAWCNVLDECETVWEPLHHQTIPFTPAGLDAPVAAFVKTDAALANGGFAGGSFTQGIFLESGDPYTSIPHVGVYFVSSDPGLFHVHATGPLGGGATFSVDGPVLAFAAPADASGVYLGGEFATASVDGTDVAASRVAFWDRVLPSALGSGTDDRVRALSLLDDDLYAGGDFQTAGGAPASFIARWDGSAWSDVGGGVDGSVHALTTGNLGCGDDLFVGGSFAHVGTGAIASALVARWDGSAWSDLSQGLPPLTGGGEVRALAVWNDGSGPALYAGGDFDAFAASHLAKWSCSTLEPRIPFLFEVDICPICPVWFFDDGDLLPEWIQCEAGGEQIALRHGEEVAACGATVRLGTVLDDVIRIEESGPAQVEVTFVFGGPGHDTIFGGSRIDILFGGEGNDRLEGGTAGDDRLFGGAGDDELYGYDGDDLLAGGSGRDRLSGAAGQDLLGGGDGDDLLVGGPQDDALLGGPGTDRLEGGAGDDRERQD